MEKKISATEAVRKFSEILSHVHYRGDSYTIIRGGKAMASIMPLPRESESRTRTLGELSRLVAGIPKLGDESEAFESDIQAALKELPAHPGDDPWE
jgi:antitoxin (DNA-binding transcriptional repressor) of toxin-antitoxin stability system